MVVDKTLMLRVEVVYARPEAQVIEQVTLADGATVRQAIEQSGITERFPEIELARAAVGIYGARTTLDTLLKDGDRVEIYRPLKADPKEARRRRVQARRVSRL